MKIRKSTAPIWHLKVSYHDDLVLVAEKVTDQFRKAKVPPVAIYLSRVGQDLVLWEYLEAAGLPMRIQL